MLHPLQWWAQPGADLRRTFGSAANRWAGQPTSLFQRRGVDTGSPCNDNHWQSSQMVDWISFRCVIKRNLNYVNICKWICHAVTDCRSRVYRQSWKLSRSRSDFMLGQRFYERCRTEVEDLHVTLQETELRRGKYKYEVEMAKVQCSSRKIIEVPLLCRGGGKTIRR